MRVVVVRLAIEREAVTADSVEGSVNVEMNTSSVQLTNFNTLRINRKRLGDVRIKETTH